METASKLSEIAHNGLVIALGPYALMISGYGARISLLVVQRLPSGGESD